MDKYVDKKNHIPKHKNFLENSWRTSPPLKLRLTTQREGGIPEGGYRGESPHRVVYDK